MLGTISHSDYQKKFIGKLVQEQSFKAKVLSVFGRTSVDGGNKIHNYNQLNASASKDTESIVVSPAISPQKVENDNQEKNKLVDSINNDKDEILN